MVFVSVYEYTSLGLMSNFTVTLPPYSPVPLMVTLPLFLPAVMFAP
ncbi:MAG: hypothetical protein NC092_12835 [Butyrivibrio sp.]|nr:hypothetical protein [Butyrivibrio sp.]